MNQRIDNILVIKVGTSTLTRRNMNGQLELDMKSFKRIGQQVINLKDAGYTIAIVSSAAITAGMVETGLAVRPSNTESSMPTLQALASIGWRHVLNAWDDALEALIIGELLVTRQELERDSERSELLRVARSLMLSGAVPIINENDAITHEKIAYGDNDTLAANFAVRLKRSSLFGDKVSVVVLSAILMRLRSSNRFMTLVSMNESRKK
jgi:glutamate 5-kinase